MSASAVLVVIITIFIPPLGVFLIKGCGVDLCINILLTLLGYLPGHIHAFYLEYVYYKRREDMQQGYAPPQYQGAYTNQPNYGAVR